MLDRRSVLAFKTEGTPGTAESLTQSEVYALNVFNAVLSPEVDADGGDEALAGGGAGTSRTVMGARKGKVTFETELYGSGVGGSPDPSYFTDLLAACGYVQASANVYTPSLLTPDAPASTTKSLTFGLYKDGKCNILHGCMGTARFRLTAGKAVRVAWEFRGCWSKASDVAVLNPGVQVLSPAYWRSGTCTVATVALKVASLELDLGNELYLREDPSTATGYYCAAITDMKPGGTIDPESVLVATADREGDWLAHTERALSFSFGSGAGSTITIAAPKYQIINDQPANRGKMYTDAISFRCNRSAAAGNDMLSITFA